MYHNVPLYRVLLLSRFFVGLSFRLWTLPWSMNCLTLVTPTFKTAIPVTPSRLEQFKGSLHLSRRSPMNFFRVVSNATARDIGRKTISSLAALILVHSSSMAAILRSPLTSPHLSKGSASARGWLICSGPNSATLHIESHCYREMSFFGSGTRPVPVTQPHSLQNSLISLIGTERRRKLFEFLSAPTVKADPRIGHHTTGVQDEIGL